MSSWLNGLMGKAVAPTQKQSVSTLLERVENVSTAEERRKAIADLRLLVDNPIHVKEIGTEGLPILMKRLKNDKTDVDASRAIIQLLISIMSVASSELRTVPRGTPQYENIALFVKNPENAAIVLSLLEEHDKNLRYFSTKLLTYLLANQGAAIEAAVLTSPANITRLMDLLKLGNEMIRNEALLLLIEISKTNVELQKVIAFENGFENLLSIIESEGLANGGIVVQDCLTLINNLLSGNMSNQNHFREMQCIKRLPDLLKLEQSDFWSLSDDKKDILLLTLNVVCALLSSPSSIPISQSHFNGSGSALTASLAPSSSIQSTQTQLGVHRIHARVIELAFAMTKVPTVRIKALWALGDLIFLHNENRTFLEQNDFKAPTGNGRVSAILKVAQVTFASKVPIESLAALHVLKCYFAGNPAGQRIVAATIATPSANQLDEAYPGRIIVRQLLAWESDKDNVIRTFCATLALSYVLHNNTAIKEQLLKLPIDASGSDTLFSFVVKSLAKAIKLSFELPVIIGLLRLLCAWVEECPLAAAQFRQVPAALTTISELIQRNEVHSAGAASFLYALVVDAATLQDPAVAAAQQLITIRLDALRKSSEFTQVEHGGPRMNDADGKMPFFDSFFIVSFLRLLFRIWPASATAPTSKSVATPTTAQTTPVGTAQHSFSAAPSTSLSSTTVVPTVVSAADLFSSHPIVPTTSIATGTKLPQVVGTAANPTVAPAAAPPSSVSMNGHSHHHSNGHSHHPTGISQQNHMHDPTALGKDHVARADFDALLLKFNALSQEQHLWKQEKAGLESQVHQLHSHINLLQSQLQGKQSQNDLLMAQLTSLQQLASAALPSSESAAFNKLQSEYDELNAAHEDLLVLLAETQEENETLKARFAGPQVPHSKAHTQQDEELLL